jgi:hypothetical protein
MFYTEHFSIPIPKIVEIPSNPDPEILVPLPESRRDRDPEHFSIPIPNPEQSRSRNFLKSRSRLTLL